MRITSLLPVVVMKISAWRLHLPAAVPQTRPLQPAAHRSGQLGHLYAGTRTAQRGGRPFAHIAVAADHGNLAGHHGVGGAADAIDQRFLTAVFVVEFRLGDRVIHVDRWERQVAVFHQLIQAVHTGGGFFRDTPLDLVAHLGEPTGAELSIRFLDLRLDDLFFFRGSGTGMMSSPASARAPSRMYSVASPPSSRIMFGPSSNRKDLSR